MPMAKAPAAKYSAAFAGLTPPVGIKRRSGNGPRSARMYFGPPTLPTGNIFTARTPASSAAITSVGVRAPGIARAPRARATSSTATDNPGLTRNCAPAFRHSRACNALETVPAPTSTRSPQRATTSRMVAIASGTVMVISAIGIPPASMASTASSACCDVLARITGITPISPICRSTSSGFIVKKDLQSPAEIKVHSACDARRLSLHQVQYILERRHGSVAGRRHGQRAMGRSTLERPLDILPAEKSIQQTRDERIAPAHSVVNLEVFARGRFVEFTFAVAGYGSPIVSAGRVGGAQGNGNQRNVGIFIPYGFHHRAKTCHLEFAEIFVHSGNGKAKSDREVLFVADQDIH